MASWVKYVGFALLTSLYFFALVKIAQARGPGWALSMPTFQDDGDVRIPFRVTVDSETPVSPFVPDKKKDRAFILWNPKEDFDLLISTFPTFTADDAYWFVEKSSGFWISSNHQQFWMLYPPGSQPGEVKGMIEKQ